MSNRTSAARLLSSLPGGLFLLAFMAVPIAIVITYSALTAGRFGGVRLPVSIENYATLLEPVYRSVILTSIVTAAVATAIAIAIGYPAALAIASLPSRWQTIALLAVVAPFWTNFLIRTYAWIVLLNREGLVNDAIGTVGLGPWDMLYNRGAVVLGLVYAYIPLMVLPLYASLQRLDPALIEAARNLGARRWRRFRTVVLPLTLPGLITGCLFVFVPSIGNFVIPELLGGGTSQMMGNVVRDSFLKARDWPFGSAMSVMVLVLMFVLVSVQARQARLARLRSGS